MPCKYNNWTKYGSWKYILLQCYLANILNLNFSKKKIHPSELRCFHVSPRCKQNCKMDFRMKPPRDLSYIGLELWWFLQEQFFVVSIGKPFSVTDLTVLFSSTAKSLHLPTLHRHCLDGCGCLMVQNKKCRPASWNVSMNSKRKINCMAIFLSWANI